MTVTLITPKLTAVPDETPEPAEMPTDGRDPGCTCTIDYTGSPDEQRTLNRECPVHGSPEPVDMTALNDSLFATWQRVTAERAALPTSSYGTPAHEALDLLGHLLINAARGAQVVRTMRRSEAANAALLAAAKR